MWSNLSFSIEEWPSGYAFTSRRKPKRTYFLVILVLVTSVGYALQTLFKWRSTITRLVAYLALVISFSWFSHKHLIVEEKLIMLNGFGIQIEHRSIYGTKSIRNIPIGNIKHFLINEAFLMNEVVFYIMILPKNSQDIVVPFRNAIPRLESLKTIYNTFNKIFGYPKKSGN